METGYIKPTTHYMLFLYREELSRSKVHYNRLNRRKLTLTDDLISKSVKNIKECSMADLEAIIRELKFKKMLAAQIKRMKKSEKLGVQNANPNTDTTEFLVDERVNHPAV